MKRHTEYTVTIGKRDDPVGWRVWLALIVLWLSLTTVFVLVALA